MATSAGMSHSFPTTADGWTPVVTKGAASRWLWITAAASSGSATLMSGMGPVFTAMGTMQADARHSCRRGTIFGLVI